MRGEERRSRCIGACGRDATDRSSVVTRYPGGYQGKDDGASCLCRIAAHEVQHRLVAARLLDRPRHDAAWLRPWSGSPRPLPIPYPSRSDRRCSARSPTRSSRGRSPPVPTATVTPSAITRCRGASIAKVASSIRLGTSGWWATARHYRRILNKGQHATAQNVRVRCQRAATHCAQRHHRCQFAAEVAEEGALPLLAAIRLLLIIVDVVGARVTHVAGLNHWLDVSAVGWLHTCGCCTTYRGAA